MIEIPDWKNVILQGGNPETTNNRMELTAAIEGLSALEKIPGTAGKQVIILRSDSKRLCDAFNQGWIEKWRLGGWRTAKKGPVKNRDLWEELDRLASGKKIVWQWVKDHAGDPMNELCNRIANEEAEAADVLSQDRMEARLEDDEIHHLGYAQGYSEGYEAARQDMANLLNEMRPQLELHFDDYLPCKGESMKTTFEFQAEKFRELALYMAQQSQDDPRFCAVKLVELLFYSDFGAYRLLGKPITGATYQRFPQDPVPKEWTEARQFLLDTEIATQEVRRYCTGNQMRIAPRREPDLSLFSEAEINLVDEALREFEHYNATSISDFSRREWAWRSTKYREEIPYNLAWVSAGPLTAEQVEAGLEVAEREGLLVE